MALDPLAGLRSRAFNDPASDYLAGARNPSGSFVNDAGQRYSTGYQDEVDERAQDAINRRYAKGMALIDAQEKATDPMARAIEARKKTLAYESLMPAGKGEEPYVRFGLGGNEPKDYYDQSATQAARGRTVGDVQDLMDAYEKSRNKYGAEMQKDIAVEQAKGDAPYGSYDALADQQLQEDLAALRNHPDYRAATPQARAAAEADLVAEARAKKMDLRRKHLERPAPFGFDLGQGQPQPQPSAVPPR